VLVAALVSVGLIAACSGDDDKNISGDGATTTAGGSETTAGGPDNTGEPTTLPPPTTVAGLEPVQGGSLVMGIEADTSSPWVPAEMVCAISCHQVIRSVYDPLALPNADNTVTPYLAESITSNDDFTVWTITARSDVTFHDGTPFDGAAIVDNLSRHKAGLLTGKVFKDVTTIEVDPADPMSAVVTISTPWAAFPFALTGSIGYMASPTWLAATDADATQKSKPVGTGPFTYVDYVPNEFFKAERNDDYWNQPYPYLDAIEFRPIPDALNRRDALKSGTVDLIHTTNGQTIADFRETGEFPMVEITNKGETGYSMLHVTNPNEPALQDRRVRCALAHATDNQAIIDTIGAGVNPIANGPFSPTQVGYLEDTGFPVAQDIPKAQELIAEYKAENPGSITISLATTQDETNLTVAQFQKQWFEEAGIDEVTLDQIDQGSYIVQALLGNFEVFQWRNHGGFDLDNQYIWWHSSTSLDIGQLALNFGRIKDPALDALLDENRAIQDPVRKKEIAEEVNRLFATECYNLWGSWTTWGIPHKENVQGISDFTLPNGDVTSLGAGISGTFYAHTLWVQP
jgi:peptide/nickel transport system substrate-binding protein